MVCINTFLVQNHTPRSNMTWCKWLSPLIYYYPFSYDVGEVEAIVVSQHFSTDGEARFDRYLINLTGAVNRMSQQLTALFEAMALTVPPGPGAEQLVHLSSSTPNFSNWSSSYRCLYWLYSIHTFRQQLAESSSHQASSGYWLFSAISENKTSKNLLFFNMNFCFHFSG